MPLAWLDANCRVARSVAAGRRMFWGDGRPAPPDGADAHHTVTEGVVDDADHDHQPVAAPPPGVPIAGVITWIEGGAPVDAADYHIALRAVSVPISR